MLLASAALCWPIVLAPALRRLAGVAPDCDQLGIMLPYTPLHHLLFAEGAPDALVMTSANRSNEPIAYQDDEALEGFQLLSRLEGIIPALETAHAIAWVMRERRRWGPAAVPWWAPPPPRPSPGPRPAWPAPRGPV